MIAWMQKHNKYLVVTIWIATIAFIGAGFVGWGTYQYGSKAGAIAEVGSVKITQEKFNFTYQNLYRQYAELYKGNFDDAKAKEMGLDKKAYQQLVAQAMFLNLAQEYGVVVSDEELADAIAGLPAFQTGGHFDKRVYQSFLEARGLQARGFESILRDDLTIEKLLGLINLGSVPFEREVIASALSVADKIRYQVLSPSDVNVSVDDAELRKSWEGKKDQYKTPTHYKVSLLWTDTETIQPTEKELREFYQKNSFNYTDSEGKELGFEQAKKQALKDYRIKKGKKQALLDYIALKKGKKTPTETKDLPKGDNTLSAKIWKEIETTSPGEIVKPRPVGERYVTVRVDSVVEPRVMSFEEAKEIVRKEWLAKAKKDALKKKAEALLGDPKSLTKESPWLTLTQNAILSPLGPVESVQFLQKLFISNQKKGIISVNGKEVVYSISEQRFKAGENNLTKTIGKTADQIKKGEFEQSLLKSLYGKYPVKSFVKGF